MCGVVVRRALAAVLVAGCLLTGCGGDDGGSPTTEADLARILQEEREVPRDQADCMAAEAYDRLTEDELEHLRQRDEDDELDAELRRKLEAAVAPCASAGS